MDLVLAAAEKLFGFGTNGAAPSWVRDRVRVHIEREADLMSCSIEQVARTLLADPSAIDAIVSSLRVGETRFYRDEAQWEALERSIDKLFPDDVELSVLSAGCSTGEEAYTIGMLLTAKRRRFRVVGVDRSAEAIAIAREATYAADSAKHLPASWVERFCDASNGRLRVGLLVRNSVTFEECDLVKRVPSGPFHIIFFKNVLLYLGATAGEAVAKGLAAELEDEGILLPAASEVLRVQSMGLSPVRLSPSVTVFRPARRPRA